MLKYCNYSITALNTIIGPNTLHNSGDEIAIITTAPSPVTEMTQNHKGYDVPCLTSLCLENLKYASLLNIGISSAC